MAGVVFQDDFEVAQINPEGAKFEKVNRLVCKGVVYEIEFLIDVNSELFECEEGDKLTVALATSLSVDGVSEAKAIDYARGAKASLLDQFDYAMHGTVYKFEHVKDTKVGGVRVARRAAGAVPRRPAASAVLKVDARQGARCCCRAGALLAKFIS